MGTQLFSICVPAGRVTFLDLFRCSVLDLGMNAKELEAGKVLDRVDRPNEKQTRRIRMRP
jgi:hypothetical protein